MIKHLVSVLVAVAALTFDIGVASAHGCHRDIRQDDGGWHRHAQGDCDRIQTHRDGGRVDDEDRPRRYRDREYGGRDYGDDRPRCVQRCQYIGPIKQCDRYCD